MHLRLLDTYARPCGLLDTYARTYDLLDTYARTYPCWTLRTPLRLLDMYTFNPRLTQPQTVGWCN